MTFPAFTAEGALAAAAQGLRVHRGFVSLSGSHDGPPVPQRDGEYQVDHGVVRAQVRVEERSLTQAMVVEEAERLCQRSRKTPLGLCGPSTRRAFVQEAERVLLPGAPRRIVSVPLLLYKDLAFIGTKEAWKDPVWRTLVRGAFGRLVDDPLAWAFSLRSPGWEQLSRAGLWMAAKSSDPDAWARIESVDLAGRSFSFRDLDRPGARAVVGSLIAEGVPREVRRLRLAVRHRGEWRAVVLDEDGVAEIDPAPSTGGLCWERIQRRMDDVVLLADRAGLFLSAALAQMQAS